MGLPAVILRELPTVGWALWVNDSCRAELLLGWELYLGDREMAWGLLEKLLRQSVLSPSRYF